MIDEKLWKNNFAMFLKTPKIFQLQIIAQNERYKTEIGLSTINT